MSTFHGLEMAKRALSAQQGALYTTSNNIANVNTDGYTRQRVNFGTRSPLNVQGAGLIGTGVDIGAVERIRDQFLDMQYRTENSRLGFWETRGQELNQMQVLFNEPSETGLAQSMDQFWQALKNLENEAEHTGIRTVVAQRGLAFTETLNYLANGLHAMNKEVGSQIDHSVESMNQIVNRIGELNQQIGKIEMRGLLANDLYDERDQLIDQLSGFMNIKVHQVKSAESAPVMAEGIYHIEVVGEDGGRIDDGVFLLKDDAFAVSLDKGQTGVIASVQVGGQDIGLQSSGRLAALIEMYGYEDQGQIQGEHAEFLEQLNKMVAQFAAAFNETHEAVPTSIAFFVTKDGSPEFTADNITVNPDIISDPSKIAADQTLANVLDGAIMGETSIREYYASLIGTIGAKGETATQMKNQMETVQAHIGNARMSTSAVSLDEEITNMIKFQHAYNAAARNMTVVDELLEVVINRMGIVGR
jgi:flagellar hook-associated protein 1 FlgK